MFGNIYRKYILRAVRSREMIIWTLLFPIALATLFHFAFSGLEEADTFHSIPTAVVESSAFGRKYYLREMLEMLGEGENAVLDLTWAADTGEAEELLKEEKVKGYIAVEETEVKLYVREDGIYQTILKNLLDRYLQTEHTIQTIVEDDPKRALALAGEFADASGSWDMEAFEESLNGREGEALIGELRLSGRKPSETASYYYALLAMLCMYGGFHGLVLVEGLQANLSLQGARNTLSPGNQYRLFVGSYLGALTIQTVCVIVSICYMRFVLRVDFGAQLGWVFATGFVGSMNGIAFGSLIGLPSKWKGGVKNGILVGVSMICSFLAGLMVSGINYLVQKHVPAVAMINPAARIADAFYCLYYYDGHTRYFQNIGILLVMTAVFLGISIAAVRRVQYESI